MDICVRNGNYDDALDLRAFVAKLALIHSPWQCNGNEGLICGPSGCQKLSFKCTLKCCMHSSGSVEDYLPSRLAAVIQLLGLVLCLI